MRKNGVRSLLMGGQACVFYGAAEFSRDLDLFILCNSENLGKLGLALEELEAKTIAVPGLAAEYLNAGHAIHFRAQRPDIRGLRIDVMSELRGRTPFESLWERRTVLEVNGMPVDIMALQDLVTAKKTQRDKDWPMISRLVEQSYFAAGNPSPEQTRFWLLELRSPEILIRVARDNPTLALKLAEQRNAIVPALEGDEHATARRLRDEEQAERTFDREYWRPLKAELESLRHRLRSQT